MKTLIQKDTHTPTFTAALFTIAKTWKQPKCPSAYEWMRKMWSISIYIYTHTRVYMNTQKYICRYIIYMVKPGFPGGSVVENPPANAGDVGSIPGQEDLLEKEMQPTPVFLPGKSHGQRSLAGYSRWGHKRVRHHLATKQRINTYKDSIHISPVIRYFLLMC